MEKFTYANYTVEFQTTLDSYANANIEIEFSASYDFDG